MFGEELSVFSLKARLNILTTGELLSKQANADPQTQVCHACKDGKLDSLAHRLNSCPQNFTLYTYRHNLIEATLVKYLRSAHTAMTFNRGVTTNRALPDVELSDANAVLRPDIIGVDDSNVFIVEVSCPYGDNKDPDHPQNPPLDAQETFPTSSSLYRVFRHKFLKYSSLRDEVEKGVNQKVTLVPIIVSSCGVIPACTTRAVELLFKNKRTRKLVLKEISHDAVVGSWVTYHHKPARYIGDRRPCPLDAQQPVPPHAEDAPAGGRADNAE